MITSILKTIDSSIEEARALSMTYAGQERFVIVFPDGYTPIRTNGATLQINGKEVYSTSAASVAETMAKRLTKRSADTGGKLEFRVMALHHWTVQREAELAELRESVTKLSKTA